MAKFRKKPIIIEAFQLTKETRESGNYWPTWAFEAWNKDRQTPNSIYPTKNTASNGTLSIMTLEGEHLVSFDDYIIRGIQGELYPCKPDIFEASYELVEE